MCARPLSLVVAAVGATTLIALPMGGARADEPGRVVLTWIADPSCPSGDAVVSAVERLVRGSPTRDRVVARAEVVHEGSWGVRLETESGGRLGKRTIEAGSCEQLAEATALILALMIDPSVALRQPEPSALLPHVGPSPPSGGEPAPAPRPSPPASLPSTPPPGGPRLGSTTAFLFVAASVAGDVGTLPGPAAGAGASGGLSAGAWRFTADLGYFPSQVSHLAQRPSAGGHFTLVTGALVVCRSVVAVFRVRGGLCLGGELDGVWAQGFGVPAPGAGDSRWGALLGGGLVEVPIAGPASVELRVAGTVPFARPPFYFHFDDNVTLYRPSAVGLRLGLGAAVRF
jgi:hypothetical protein